MGSSYHTREIKTPSERDACTPKFPAARTRERPKCLLTDERMERMWRVHGSTLLGLRQKEALPRATPWKQLEDLRLREVSQTQKGKDRMISLMCRTSRSIRRKQTVVNRGLGLGMSGESRQRVRTLSGEVSRSRRSDVQPGGYRWPLCTVCVTSADRVALKCSHQKNN